MATIEFWKGTNGLDVAKKSDASITGLDPGAFVVRSDGVVFLGTNQTGDAVKVEKADSSDNYASWSDLTGSLNTSKAIKGLDST